MNPLDDRRHCARIVLWAHGHGGHQPGGFGQHLLAAWGRADHQNQLRLSQVYPVLGSVIEVFGARGETGLNEILEEHHE